MWVWISANDSPSLAWKHRHAGMDHAGRSRRSFPAQGRLPQAPTHTLKMPVPKHLPFAKLNQTLVFQNPERFLLLRQDLNEADKNWSVVSVSGGCQSKPCITGRAACALEDETLQKAGAKRKMCYFKFPINTQLLGCGMSQIPQTPVSYSTSMGQHQTALSGLTILLGDHGANSQ